jgi:hypothetical protein
MTQIMSLKSTTLHPYFFFRAFFFRVFFGGSVFFSNHERKKQTKRRDYMRMLLTRSGNIALTIIITLLTLSLLCRLFPVRLGGFIVNLSEFYSYRLIGKLTAFLKFQEFSRRHQTWDHSSTFAVRLFLPCSNHVYHRSSIKPWYYLLILTWTGCLSL